MRQGSEEKRFLWIFLSKEQRHLRRVLYLILLHVPKSTARRRKMGRLTLGLYLLGLGIWLSDFHTSSTESIRTHTESLTALNGGRTSRKEVSADGCML